MSETKILRVMADANVLFSAYGWPRFPYEVLQHAVNKDYQLVLSTGIINEAFEALREYFDETQANTFLTFVAATNYEEVETPSIEEIEANTSLIRDPKDIHVALAAINAGVDYLVTRDRDFTDRDESTKALHQQLAILSPGTFLRNCMGWTSDNLEQIASRKWSDFET